MKMKLIIPVLLILSSTVQAMTWVELSEEIESVESGAAGNRDIILRFSEMVHMMVSYSRQLRQENLQPLFCPPQGQAINIDDLVSIVRAEARRQDARPDALVQDLLLSGFAEEFPCE